MVRLGAVGAPGQAGNGWVRGHVYTTFTIREYAHYTVCKTPSQQLHYTQNETQERRGGRGGRGERKKVQHNRSM